MGFESLVEQLLQDPSSVSSVCIDISTEMAVTRYLKAQMYRQWDTDFDAALRTCDLLRTITENEPPAVENPLDPVEIAGFGERIYSDPAYTNARLLDDQVAGSVIRYLKARVDEHWWKDTQKSIDYAHAIQRLGTLRDAPSEIALGVMAYGDSLRIQGTDNQRAWNELDRAGRLFLEDGNAIGWARTRIGRVAICADFDYVAATLAEVHKARRIFLRYDAQEYLLRLELNTALAHNNLGDYEQAATTYEAALQTAHALGNAGQPHLGAIYTNLGFARMFLGDFRPAMTCFQTGRELFAARGESHGQAIAELNIAYLEQAQGHYNRALKMLYEVQGSLADKMPLEAARTKRARVECYLQLDRYADARKLALEIMDEFDRSGATYDLACALRLLATAEAELGRFEQAERHLDHAETLFAALDAATWVAAIHLLRGRIALRKGNPTAACGEAETAETYFAANGQRVNYARAILLRAEATMATGEYEAALVAATKGLRIAQQCNMSELRYQAHLLLGRIQEARGLPLRCIRHYRAAVATVQRAQHRLTITLRPGFLQSRGEALQALMRLALESQQIAHAFTILEFEKSQTFLGYLANRERLYWMRDSEVSRGLIAELNRLREEHHWYYRLTHERDLLSEGGPSIEPDVAAHELSVRESRMRAITEQLYIHSSIEKQYIPAAEPNLRMVQDSLPDDTVLIEYYYDGVAHFEAIVIGQTSIDRYLLPKTVSELQSLLDKLQFNIRCAITEGLQTSAAHDLAHMARQLCHELYSALLAPFAEHLRDLRRIVIVPYSTLHYVPFNLLYTGQRYLIEHCEVVVLPAAGLLARQAPQREKRALVIAHSNGGNTPQTLAEAEIVHGMFPGQLYLDDAARRTLLAAPAAQILHIASHGKHRLDHPDLSYLLLADGQLYADDLLQYDLSYELVTLSACETGRVTVSPGEELIGLGRGILYAGAGALVSSLWRVDDACTVQLMECFYHLLDKGQSKAAALQQAQMALLHDGSPPMHPAFWGAFQLIGNADPLSQFQA
jgi:CHAT domain-containing protein/predicted negative regulator of RcsB-dependent stress response